MKHFSSGEKFINKPLSHKNTPERQTVELSSAHYLGHVQATCVGGTNAYPARHGGTIIPCLSHNSSIFLPLGFFFFFNPCSFNFDFFSHKPINTWMAFNNLLSFQLLDTRVGFPEEPDAGGALGASQGSWLDPWLQLQINLLLNLTFWAHFHSVSSVQFSRSVMSDSLRPHESQHARPPCPSPTPGVHSDSRPSSQWCHSAISSSVVPFSSCP